MLPIGDRAEIVASHNSGGEHRKTVGAWLRSTLAVGSGIGLYGLGDAHLLQIGALLGTEPAASYGVAACPCSRRRGKKKRE